MRLAAITLVTILAACGGAVMPAPSQPAQLDGSWQLGIGSMDGQRLPTLADHPVTLTVEGSEIGGTAACNSYGGRMTIGAGGLEIEDLGMTAMGCADDVMAVESGYMAALGRVSGIARDGDELVMTGPGVELRFQALPEPPTAELVDTTWVLETIFVGDVASAAMGERATLAIRSDGSLDGSTGCRGFDGAWVERGEQILAHTLAMTDEVCPDALSDQDSHVTSVIGDGFVPTIDGDLLTLSDPGGVGLVYRADR